MKIKIYLQLTNLRGGGGQFFFSLVEHRKSCVTLGPGLQGECVALTTIHRINIQIVDKNISL